MNLNSERKERLFNAARALADPKECAAFLDAACQDDPALRGELEALLAAQTKAHSYFDKGVHDPGLTSTKQIPENERPGERIGRYKLREKIGEGGCGVVYVAEQD